MSKAIRRELCALSATGSVENLPPKGNPHCPQPLLPGFPRPMTKTSHRPFLARWLPDSWFYGWVMVGVGGAGLFASSPGQTYTVSIVLEGIMADFDLSRTAVSTAYSLGTAIAGLGLTFFGPLLDRIGPRRMLGAVVTCLGGVCLLLPMATNIPGLVLAFTVLRLSGQGAMTLVSFNLVAQWFVKRRGLATTFTSLGGALGSAFFPPFLLWLVGHWGWRTGYMILGGIVWMLIMPLSVLLVVDRPEALGLNPDGAVDVADSTLDEDSADRRDDWTRPEALRTRAFWVLAFSNAVPAMLMTGLMFHQVSYFQEQGLSAALAAGLFSVFSVSMVAATFASGPMLDRLDTRAMVCGGLVMLPLAMCVMLFANSPAIAVLYAVLLGVTSGVYWPTANFIWPRYFGRTHLGSIQGTANTILVIGAALGPLPFGWAFDVFGGYKATIAVLALLPLGFAILVATTPPPERSLSGVH